MEFDSNHTKKAKYFMFKSFTQLNLLVNGLCEGFNMK